MAETQPFKNYYGVELAQDLAVRITAVYPDFPAGPFIEQVAAQVEPLELKARVAVIAAALRANLPAPYLEALRVLLAILGPPNSDEEGMFTAGYHLMPVAYFVEVYGLDHFDESMAALYEITQRHTAEYAIRPYLERYPQPALTLLERWAGDQSAHVRRLVSEGTRPRLPWASRLPAFMADPDPVLRLLEQLKNDPSAYVRKSVANNLNDIGKAHPELVLATLTRWSQHSSDKTRWIIGHALRNFVKQGHRQALALLGFEQPQAVQLQRFKVDPASLKIGDSLTLSFNLQNQAAVPQQLVIDYIIHLRKANGQLNPKVFKLGVYQLDPGQTIEVQKKHSFRPVTTRRYYAGQQRVELQVNGLTLGGVDFNLEG